MRYALLGGLAVLFVLGFLIYAKTRLPEPSAPRDRDGVQASADGASSRAAIDEPEPFRRAPHEPARREGDTPTGDASSEPTSLPDGDLPSARRTADPSRDDDTGTGDPRRYTQEDDRGSNEEQLRQASALRAWIGDQKALMADVAAVSERVRGGDAAAAQDFNDAFDELAQELVDRFGARLAHEYAKRIPIYHMDVETGELVRVDETGQAIEEPSRRGRRDG